MTARILHFSVFALLLCAGLAVNAEGVVKWKDASGKLHFGDAAPKNQAVQSVEFLDVDAVNTFKNVAISDAPNWQGFFKPAVRATVKDVVMYSTRRCGYCKQARRYFESNNIAFTERKIDQDQEAWEEYQQLQASGVPVIFVGNKRMDGFNEGSFEELFYSGKPKS